MKNKSIEKVLGHCNRVIPQIANAADGGDVLDIEIKNTLENLRSCLEYVAHNIASSLQKIHNYDKFPQRINFPYGDSQRQFKKSIKSNLPDLGVHLPEVFRAIEQRQKFTCGDNWLSEFCRLTNFAKHKDLHEVDTHKSFKIDMPALGVIQGRRGGGKGRVSIQGVRINGIEQDDIKIDSDGSIQITKKAGRTKVTLGKTIFFQGKEIPIPIFLQECLNNVEALVIEIESHL